MLNYNAPDFVGIILTIFIFFYLTVGFQWGLYQVIRFFFEDKEEDENKSVTHRHYHYRAIRQ